MFNTTRTSARTLLVATSTAGFVALGTGIAGADTLGGVTDGLALGDLGSQVPAPLTEGAATPLGDLVKIQPDQFFTQPDVRHQAASEEVLEPVAGSALFTGIPVETEEEKADAVDLLDLGGGTLPLSHAQTPMPLENTTGAVGGGLHQVGSLVERGTHEVGGDLSGLDATLPSPGEPLPLAATDGPVAPVNGQNTDLTGGTADVVFDLVLSDDVALPMSASSLPGTVGDTPVDLLPAPEETLPLAAPEVKDVTGLAVDTVRTTQLNPGGDFLGDDLVDVSGLPDLGQPGIDTGQLDGALPDGLI